MSRRARWVLAAVAATMLGGATLVATGAALAPRDVIDTSRMKPSFTENFDGARLDDAKWWQGKPDDPITNRTLSGNAERQLYFDPAYLGLGVQPLTLGHGMLRITASPLSPALRAVVATQVAALPASNRAPALAELAYASGRISTLGRFAQKYGYFEIRARFDAGRGLWPAFWLLPATGAWPPEIDVMEALGHDPDTVYATVHSTAMRNQAVTSKLAVTADGFHRYGVLWGPKTIMVYVDGVRTGVVDTPADAHQPMYMIVNLAVGGHWPGYPDAGTRFPATMDVDYVRAWKLLATAER